MLKNPKTNKILAILIAILYFAMLCCVLPLHFFDVLSEEISDDICTQPLNAVQAEDSPNGDKTAIAHLTDCGAFDDYTLYVNVVKKGDSILDKNGLVRRSIYHNKGYVFNDEYRKTRSRFHWISNDVLEISYYGSSGKIGCQNLKDPPVEVKCIPAGK